MTPLKAARIARGWSQEKLAKLAKLPQPTISRAERSGSATTDIALKIAAAMGSTVEELFDAKASGAASDDLAATGS